MAAALRRMSEEWAKIEGCGCWKCAQIYVVLGVGCDGRSADERTPRYMLDRDRDIGEWIYEARGSGRNKPRRFTLDEAIAIALEHVDTHTINGCTAAQASASVAARLASTSPSSVRAEGTES